MLRKVFVCIFSLFVMLAMAQNTVTSISGVVTDKETGEVLPFVNVYFTGTQIGTTTDIDGKFTIKNTGGYKSLTFQYLGYKTEEKRLLTVNQNRMQVKLEPDAFGLAGVEIKPKRKDKNRYTRKGNPAVELIQEVIAHKDSNRITSQPVYTVEMYEKTILSLERDTFNFNRNNFWKKFAFLDNYVDTSEINPDKRILTFSLREHVSNIYYRKRPRAEKEKLYSDHIQGLDALMQDNGFAKNVEEMLQTVDIYDNTISLLLNKFVSPISSTVGNSFYQYYIIDTIMIDNRQCIDLAFVPVNSESYGFTGHLYILNDGSYAIKRAQLNVPQHINLNFVNALSVVQEFDTVSNGAWALSRSDTYLSLGLLKKSKQQFYAHQMQSYRDYDFSVSTEDPTFSVMGERIVKDTVDLYWHQWPPLRHVPLPRKEAVLDSIMWELDRIPEFHRIIKTGETFANAYISTADDYKKSKFDIGQIWSFVSWNKLEGARFRLGGTSTGNLNPHFFFSGFVAAGTKDWIYYAKNYGPKSGAAHGLKYGLTLTYSFNEKKYHPYEAWRDAIFLSTEYDVYEPGVQYAMFEKDNIFMNIPFSKPDYDYMPYYYRRYTELRYEKEWPNRLRIKTFFDHEINEAAGTLQYLRYDAAGNLTDINHFSDVELGFELRYAPGEPIYDSRTGKENLFSLSQDAPVLKIGHRVGFLDYKPQNIYNITEFSLDYRIWMAAFGHIDMTVRAGIEWNKAPFPKLFLPNANQGIILQPKSFNLMKPMEFISDQYVSWHLTYYMKGLIFNRIPGFNRLQLREVISFSGLYGRLTPKNDPHRLLVSEDFTNEGLYELPDGVHAMGRGERYCETNDKIPYMEMTVGIENIFKCIRIDYVRRLNYVGGLGPWEKNGIRVSLRFTL